MKDKSPVNKAGIESYITDPKVRRSQERNSSELANAEFVARSLETSLNELFFLIGRYTGPAKMTVLPEEVRRLVAILGTHVAAVQRWSKEYDKKSMGQTLSRPGRRLGLKNRVEHLREVYDREVKGKLEEIRQELLEQTKE